MGRSRLWSISWLHHQMFYPCVTISAAQARKSDDLRHAMSPFSLCLSSFSGAQRILGYVRPRKIVAVHPPKTGNWDTASVVSVQFYLTAASQHLKHLSKVIKTHSRHFVADLLTAVMWKTWPLNSSERDSRPKRQKSIWCQTVDCLDVKKLQVKEKRECLLFVLRLIPVLHSRV